MPKLPQLKQQQRVEVGTPVQAISPNNLEAEALQRLGSQMQTSALQLNALRKERDRTNNALITQQ